MDDTHVSRASDAAATRKRRSSILKSQRPPRTPFSDLEFNVATPTDTSKSRRVSFSRRTGVAEFATNEATTTWKNFYEEHNKSLESSGNDSGSKQAVGHLGKRIFDRQFEEVEADFIGIHNSGPNLNISSSLNNFEHQLIALESTDDIKLTAPQNKFELSAFTNSNTKLFDEIAIPNGEVTDRIDINFSTVQHIDGNDYLDEIQNDLKQNYRQTAFDRPNMSEYIDLNVTQVVKNDDDMSITDTVHSPKVNLSRQIEISGAIDVNFSIVKQIGESDDLDEIQKDLHQKFGYPPTERQNDLNISRHGRNEDQSQKVQDKKADSDWVADKENIAVNPYAALRETENFAINEEPDKVLVFDGKRLTIQSEKGDKENRQTIIPNPLEKAQQRKTIVLNVNDDLPNFVDESHTAHTSGFIEVAQLKKNMVLDDMSITEPIDNVKQRTVLYDSDLGNISVTQAVPSNIVAEDKGRTILYEDGTGNISVTQAVSTNVFAVKRRTIVYDNDDGNISITRALPTNIVNENKINTQKNEKRNTIVFDDGNMSMTQAIPANFLQEKTAKRRTIVYEDNAGNLSITQAVPNVLLKEAKAEKRRTIVYEDETGNISVTQAIPSNIIIAENSTDRRRTVVFESNTGNISVTQVPPNLILHEQVKDIDETLPEQIPAELARRRTIVYEEDTGNLSITQAVPNQIIPMIQNLISQNDKIHDGLVNVESSSKDTNRRATIVFDNDDADISMTQAVSLNQVICAMRNEQNENMLNNNDKENQPKTDVNKKRTIVFDNDEADISMTQVVPMNVMHFNPPSEDTNIIKNSNPLSENDKSRTVVFENAEADLSITQIVNNNQFKPDFEQQNVHDDLEAALNEALHNKNGKSERTIVYDRDSIDISISQTCQDTNMLISQSLRDNVIENAVKRRTIVFEDNNISITEVLPANILADYKESKPEDSQLQDLNTSNISDISMTDINEKEKLVFSDNENAFTDQTDTVMRKSLNPEQQSGHIVTKPIPSNLLTINNDNLDKSLKDQDMIAIGNEAQSFTEVLIYQTALTKRTEQGDSITQEPIAIQNDEKLSSSSKIPDDNELKQNDDKISASSKVSSAKEVTFTDALTLDNQENYESQNEVQNDVNEPNQQVAIDNQSQASTDSTSRMSKSIVHDLLDMSSSADGTEDKGLMAQVDASKDIDSEYFSSKEDKCYSESGSNEEMFVITKDEDDEQIQTESANVPQITEHSPLPLEYKDDPDIVIDLKSKLEALNDDLQDENNLVNRHYERIISSDLDKDFDKSKVREVSSKTNKSFKAANDTNELLEMLSDLTDKTITRRLDPHLEEDEYKPESILIKGHLALENKSEIDPEPKRLSFAPRRQSIVMSREDLLNNISMAGAALKSRIDFDDSELDDTVESPEQEKSPKKSVRMSNEVVKTLNFDESTSETSITETKLTPLKKTAFGETSYMQEHKNKVIPDYLKDVSDGIKELMDDLVKPNADLLPPFTAVDKSVRKVASTQSTQIQANLITSSQIDLSSGLYSNPDSVYDINKVSSADIINDAVKRSVTRALKSPIKAIKSNNVAGCSEKSLDSKMDASQMEFGTIIPSRPTEPVPGRVLIFDHNNPLNNILLAPETHIEVHKYNPVISNETICVSERSNSAQIDYDAERVSTQYNVGNMPSSGKHSGDTGSGKIEESNSKLSNLSKPMSIDQSTDVRLSDVKDTEVNTLIAMKGNKELLDASSSLTLVDDALNRSSFDVHIDTKTTTSQEESAKSHVKIIFDHGSILSDKLESDITSNDEMEDRTKRKKRTYSPSKRDKHRQCTMSNLDVTPKPTSKMQKLSQSEFKNSEDRKPPRKSKTKKPGTNITVQQLITEYNIGPIDPETIDEQIKGLQNPKSDVSSVDPPQTASQTDVECPSLDMVSSFTSSKNLRTVNSSVISSQSSKVSGMDWKPELVDDTSSKNLVIEYDSSSNVVAKIDMLPFMGSYECEWDSSSGDTWAFRLLHARLRLAVKLEHRHDNATRTNVRADTPVRGVTLEVLPYDTKNNLAVLCVNFASETMRYFMSRGCACAGDVPTLVRRCAAAARLAARWGRVMCEARHHLAYCVTGDGLLALKVANIPLRSVWEVTLQLELVVEDAREAPWVRAGEVRVRRVLCATSSDAPPPRVTRALRHLPRDWSHAPRAIWRIFKYLKHKTREDVDDELFTGL